MASNALVRTNAKMKVSVFTETFILLVEAKPQALHMNRSLLSAAAHRSGAYSLIALRENRPLLSKVSGCLFLGFCCLDGVTKRYGTSRKVRRAAARRSRFQRAWDAAQQADFGKMGTTLHCLPDGNDKKAGRRMYQLRRPAGLNP